MKKKILFLIVTAFAICLLYTCRPSIQSDFPAYRVLGLIEPRNSTEIAISPWGIQIGTNDPEALKIAASIGVKWTRLSASWPGIEKEKGQYDWESTDHSFSVALENEITPFVVLHGGNPLYTTSFSNEDAKIAEIYGSKPGPPTQNPEAMKAWLEFVESAVSRYKDQITHWEIWNEPNHFAYWGGEPDPQEYGRLIRKTAEIIKKIQPQAVILGGSMAGLDPEFTDGFLSGGTAEWLDIVTFHNYGVIPEQRIYAAAEVRTVINKYNPGIKLWQGECGYPSHSSTRDYRGLSPWGLNIQAKWLLRQSFTDVYFCGAEMSNYFKLVHRGEYGKMQKRSFMTAIDSVLGFPERGGSRVRTLGINEKCLLAHDTWEPKPAFYAYRNLCAAMDGRYKKSDVIMSSVKIKSTGDFYGIGQYDDAFPSQPLVATFKSEDNHILVAWWLPWQAQENILHPAKINLTFENADFREPVMLDLLTGKVYSIIKVTSSNPKPITTFVQLPMLDYPLIITEKSEISIIRTMNKVESLE